MALQEWRDAERDRRMSAHRIATARYVKIRERDSGSSSRDVFVARDTGATATKVSVQDDDDDASIAAGKQQTQPRRQPLVVIFRQPYRDEEATFSDIRDLSYTRSIDPHKFILQILDTIPPITRGGRMQYVVEHHHEDLYTHIRQTGALSGQLLKVVAFQILTAVAHAHKHGVAHRNIKLPNIVVGHDRTYVQLLSFKTGRSCWATGCGKRDWTTSVTTLPYQPPEMLLGLAQYIPPAVDTWSVGVCLSMLATCEYPFMTDSEIGALLRMFHKLGTPTEESWPAISQLRHYNMRFPAFTGGVLAEELSALEPGMRSVILRCFTLDPGQRPWPAALLRDTYFDDVRERPYASFKPLAGSNTEEAAEEEEASGAAIANGGDDSSGSENDDLAAFTAAVAAASLLRGLVPTTVAAAAARSAPASDSDSSAAISASAASDDDDNGGDGDDDDDDSPRRADPRLTEEASPA